MLWVSVSVSDNVENKGMTESHKWPEWPEWPKSPKWPDDRKLRRQLTVWYIVFLRSFLTIGTCDIYVSRFPLLIIPVLPVKPRTFTRQPYAWKQTHAIIQTWSKDQGYEEGQSTSEDSPLVDDAVGTPLVIGVFVEEQPGAAPVHGEDVLHRAVLHCTVL